MRRAPANQTSLRLYTQPQVGFDCDGLVPETERVVPADNRVFGLDILRAAAILLVLIGHTWCLPMWRGVAGAFAVLGVELFFVLSGFLIGGILVRLAQNQRLGTFKDVFAFWRRRWFRTLPNYYLFLALHLLWRTWVLGYPDQASTNWEYFVFAQNLTHPPPFFFPETWSLAVEEWFYLLFPLLLLIALRTFRQPWHAWFAVITLFLLVPMAFRLNYALQTAVPTDPAAMEPYRRAWDSIIRKIVVFRLDVVMYGVVGALVAAWRPVLWKRLRSLWPLGAAFVFVAITSLIWHKPLDTAHPWGGFLLWPAISVGFALMLPAFSSLHGGSGWVGKGVSWVARVSYALYLCHGLILLALAKWFGPNAAFPLPKNTLPWCIAVWGLSFCVAGVVYRWFEKPMMDLRDHFEEPRPASPLRRAGETAVAGG